jgi:hypothetical protein
MLVNLMSILYIYKLTERQERAMVEPNRALSELRLRLARRIVEYAKNGMTALAPSVMQEDVSFYLDPDRYELEHRKFFRETPLVACL